ncbi:MucBP domain-containing protein [Levilactobacillus suantsaiihabitans]|uniref:LPXTG cell wall anchor domain-containing protein n=1 Tax=Levilactobacillus suantsaiihabitans TaxID=2487722 RepID=A0A4Z0JEH2_9LACO|nr:MucBP domain-containing protein [Levilactobacillus suantsaiihabitans]TGD19833.1 LPXTG cell wall anchor domain-containing protein [Levilactobacillus suantsaiihabitans]
MFNGMNTKEHYKMYKKGKAWVFAGIVTATLALGVAGGPTAHADTTGAAESDQESESGQSATPAKTATLSSTTKQVSTGNETEDPSTDDATTSETTTTGEQDQTPAAAKTDTVEAPTAKTTTETPAKPETPVKSATPTPTPETPTPTKDVTATITKPVTKVTTAVTPNMRIKAPTRTKMMHTARAMAPAAPTTPAPTATAAVTAATPVTEADESIDQWMPNKKLQAEVLRTLNQVAPNGKTWASAEDITKQDMLYLTGLYGKGTTWIDANTPYSLEGLQYATNLTTIVFNGLAQAQDALSPIYAGITDISPLANLTKLQTVWLECNSISDVTPLANLKNLTSLQLEYNKISDFSSLNPSQYTMFDYHSQFILLPGVYVSNTTRTAEMPFKAYLPGGKLAQLNPDGGSIYVPAVYITPDTEKFWAFFRGGDATEKDGGLVYTNLRDNGYLNMTEYDGKQIIPNQLAYYMTGTYMYDDSFPLFVVVQPYQINDDAAPVTAEYVDEQGTKLQADTILNGVVGNGYKIDAPTISGYTLTATPANATGIFSDTPQTVTFVYKEATSTVTVHYQDDQGATIKPDDVNTGKVGDAYTIDHPAISGYTYKETVGDAAGNYADTPTEVTFIYTKDSTVTPPTNPEQTITVTVHYQTADGTQVAPDVVITGKTGDAYTTSPATNVLDGYELVSTPANATGTMGDSDITVTYLYTNTGDGDQVNPEPGTPTTPTKPTKPTTEPDMVTPTKPTPSAKPQPVTGGQADTVSPAGKRTPATQSGQQGAAATVALAATATKQPATPATATKTTLPQTDEQSTSPLWGLALLGGLLGLVGFKRRKRN